MTKPIDALKTIARYVEDKKPKTPAAPSQARSASDRFIANEFVREDASIGPSTCWTSSPMNACRSLSPARLKSMGVIDVLSHLFILRGVPPHIRSDNGPEFVAKAGQECIAFVGVKSACIERGRVANLGLSLMRDKK